MPRSKKLDIEDNYDCNKDIVFDLMNQAGVEKFTIYFDGGGDDGQVSDIESVPHSKGNQFLSKIVEGAKLRISSGWANGKKSYSWKYDPTVREIIEDVVYDVLEGHFGGWENDDGSCGEFVLDATKRKVELTMKQRYYEYDVSHFHF